MIVNIEKATGRVVDVNQEYDERYYENRVVPDGTLPDYIHHLSPVKVEGAAIVPLPAPKSHQAEYVSLAANEPFGQRHAHANDQLVIVMFGQVELEDEGQRAVLNVSQRALIAAGRQHLITGMAAKSVLLTIQIK